MDKELVLKFDNHTIEHLGIKMYSRLPNALAELIANSYDANAENVKILLNDTDQNNKEIVIEDDGDGMSFDSINKEFLVIGRKRRNEDKGRKNRKGRIITGKKGLGKLALFGIGKRIEIITSYKDSSEIITFYLDWEELISSADVVYKPKYEVKTKSDNSLHGTIIKLSKLVRVTGFNLEDIASLLVKLFNIYDKTFNVVVEKDGYVIKLDREKIYDTINIEKEWDIEEIVKQIEIKSANIKTISGKIFSSVKPMKQNLRGITIYANGRLVNSPSFFGLSEAGHVFSYLSGWIDADYLDEFEDDEYIATDRQSLNWDLEETVILQNVLHEIIKKISKEWSNIRKENKKKKFKEKTNIDRDEWVEKVPTELQIDLEKVIDSLTDKETIETEELTGVAETLYKLIPPYTYYHYRLLHDEVKNSSKKEYKNKDYYKAFQEAMKRYKDSVKCKSNVNVDQDLGIMANSFGKDKLLKTTKKYVK